MTELPEPHGRMITPQGIFLEILHLLVDAGVVTEEAAIESYEKALKKYGAWQQ